MKLLFVQGGSRVRVSNQDNYYVDGNFDNEIWQRYRDYSDSLTVVLRQINNSFSESELKDKYNNIDKTLVDLKLVPDIYSPKIKFFSIKDRKIIKERIKEEVLSADRIIIRSIGNYYTNTALKYCSKYKKKYLIEVTGFGFGCWYHSLFGKIVAIPRELKIRRALKKAPFAVYVTDKALQKNYPCNGKTMGCSDVELKTIDQFVLQQRINKFSKINDDYTFKLGTIGWLNVKSKGQIDIIRAISELKKKGITNIKYELVGAGNPKKIEKAINKYSLEKEITIIGPLSHNEVFEWLSNIDVYIHPSYTEGLCRSIVEAMSMSCPIIASDVGGNSELISNKYIYRKKNIVQFKEKLLSLLNKDELISEATINFNNSKKFDKLLLKKKRDTFYKEFMGRK